MKTMLRFVWILVLLPCLIAAAPMGTAFNYQGRLNDGASPATGVYDLQFIVFDAAEGGTAVSGFVTNSATGVSNGLFTVTIDFGINVFEGSARWLQTGVRTNGAAAFTTLSPRQKLTPAPYALYAPNAGVASSAATVSSNGVGNLSLRTDAVTSDKIANFTILEEDLAPVLALNTYWRLTGNGGTTPGLHFLGTLDNQPLELKVNGQRTFRLEPGTESPNLVGGYSGNAVLTGINGAVIGGGGNMQQPNIVMSRFGTISGGVANFIGSNSGDTAIGGGWSNIISANAQYATIGGGALHTASGPASTIAGGFNNTVQLDGGFVGGGTRNQVLGYNSSIAGGFENSIPTILDGFIGGGRQNQLSANHTVIGGGLYNTNAGPGATLGGGNSNRIGPNANDSFVGGGVAQLADGVRSVLGGGFANQISSNTTDSVITGGYANQIQTNASASVIAGGWVNVIASGSVATIGGGKYNVVSNEESTIAGGAFNEARGFSSTIGGGGGNKNSGHWSVIAGGRDNQIGQDLLYTTIAGGYFNVNAGSNAFIGGGGQNLIAATADNTVLGGGAYNEIQSNSVSSFIGGGISNLVSTGAVSAVIAGGSNNLASAPGAVVGGGWNNEATNLYCTIAGGYQNLAAGSGAFVGGGLNNQAKGSRSAVVGGYGGRATNSYATVGGGYVCIAGGSYAVVPGGYYSSALGDFSFAAGYRAKATNDGAFVWADNYAADVTSTNDASVTMRARGGYRLFSDSGSTVGVRLAPGGNAWSAMSDRNVKENFRPINARAVLEKVASLPVTEWNLISQPADIRHVGPMAQDFKAAFGLGESDRHISTSDADGVALAAIQGLNQKVEEQAAALRAKDTELQGLKARLEMLEQKLNEKAQ